MTFENSNKKVSLVIEDKLLNKLSCIAIENFPNESGGLLVGNYSSDFRTLYIKDFITPKIQKKSFFYYRRSVSDLSGFLKKLYEEKSEYYIGEWHSHPNGNSMYSSTDLQAMISIAQSESVNIENPILLILGIKKAELEEFSIYVYNNKGLHKYEQS